VFIIIIITISFMQGICTYIPETKQCPLGIRCYYYYYYYYFRNILVDIVFCYGKGDRSSIVYRYKDFSIKIFLFSNFLVSLGTETSILDGKAA
jgi:hypothetical protein